MPPHTVGLPMDGDQVTYAEHGLLGVLQRAPCAPRTLCAWVRVLSVRAFQFLVSHLKG